MTINRYTLENVTYSGAIFVHEWLGSVSWAAIAVIPSVLATPG